MKYPIVTRRRAQATLDLSAAALRHELEKARNERDAALRDLRRTQEALRDTAARLAEVTAANQSYDKPIR